MSLVRIQHMSELDRKTHTPGSHVAGPQGRAPLECQMQGQVSYPEYLDYSGEGDHGSPRHRMWFINFVAMTPM